MNKFLEEIQEQPKALECTFRYYQSKEGKACLKRICDLWNSGNYDKIIFTGMGSSYFISQAAAVMISACGIPAFALNTGELLHFQFPALTSRTLLVAVSQSGESYEVVELLRKISKLSLTIVGVTNEEKSSLARMSACQLLCKAGKEEMTSSKTFITTYLAVYLLSQCLQGNEVGDNGFNEIREEVERQLARKEAFLPLALGFLNERKFIQVIGRGTVFATVSQTALMFMEATKTPASALLGGEFRHGPLEMVNQDFVCIIYAHSQSGIFDQTIKLVSDILSFKGNVILVSDVTIGIESSRLLEINVCCKSPDLFVIPAIIPIQLMVNAWAEEMELVPGSFTHGAKVTAIE